MRKVLLAALVASVSLAGVGSMSAIAQTSGAADTSATSANATQDSPDLNKNEMICKRGDVTTGSRFPGPPVCHTRMEWEQLRRNAQEAVNHMNGGTTGPHS